MNAEFNHPDSIIKHVPKSANYLESALVKSFLKKKERVGKAFKEEEEGHKSKLKFKPQMYQQKRNERRKRNIIWFMPHF